MGKTIEQVANEVLARREKHGPLVANSDKVFSGRGRGFLKFIVTPAAGVSHYRDIAADLAADHEDAALLAAEVLRLQALLAVK